MSLNKKNIRIVMLSTWKSEHLPLLLEELSLRGISAVAAVLDSKPRDRERKIQEERTKDFFEWPDFSDIEAYKLPLYVVRDHNSELSQELLEQLKPDILINAGTPRILKKHILEIPSRGVVNTHPGILPAYRGCTVVEWAVYNDDPVGATCHFMTEGIDEGPIIYSEIMPIKKGDVYEAVRTKMIYHWARVTARGIEKIQDENAASHTLPPQAEGKYYGVIPEDKLDEVKKKLKEGLYRCYTE